MSLSATALIAEDEPLLAQSLRSELARAWPELGIVASVAHGQAAVDQALSLRPDVLFLDINMPGMSGMDAAQAIAEEWAPEAELPLFVFVTAYEQFAVQAFERSASDYLLKPVEPQRLLATCRRLQDQLARRRNTSSATPQSQARQDDAASTVALLAQLRSLLMSSSAHESMSASVPQAGAQDVDEPTGRRPRLNIVQASNSRGELFMVKVDDIVYFEAADKLIRVLTADTEYLIRTSLKELQAQLDPDRFWQIHRGTLVRDDAIRSAVRDEHGRLWITLRQRPEKLPVSRLYTARFKAM